MPIVSVPGGPLLVKSKTITSAQLLALFATPITVVPAPGAGKIAYPIYGGMLVYTAGATPYTIPGAPQFAVGWPDAIGSGWAMDGYCDITQATNQAGTLQSNTTQNGNLTDIVNKPLSVAFISVGNPTLGNGTVTVTVPYAILTP